MCAILIYAVSSSIKEFKVFFELVDFYRRFTPREVERLLKLTDLPHGSPRKVTLTDIARVTFSGIK